MCLTPGRARVHLKYEGQISGNQPPRPIQAIRIPERSGAQHATRPNQPFSTKQPTKFSYPPTPLRHPLTILKCVTNSHLPVRSTSTKFVSTSMFSPVKKFTLTSLFDWNQTSMLTYSGFLKTPFCQIVFKLPFFYSPNHHSNYTALFWRTPLSHQHSSSHTRDSLRAAILARTAGPHYHRIIFKSLALLCKKCHYDI